ncbi:MAG: hypothetical protein HRU20_19945 [Pseudomonadales bacterium]|nr:hypothetical protein [Pseudomonadales bacterium]
MSISLASFKRAKLVFACSLLLPAAATTLALEPTASLKMPKVTKSLILDIDQAGDRVIAVGERGHIIYSDDQAVTWVQADVPFAQMVTALSFVDDKKGWAVAHDGHILQTLDGGSTWTLQRDGLGAQAESNVRKIKEYKIKVAEIKKQIRESVDAAEVVELELALDDAQWEFESATEKSLHAPIANPLLDVWFMDAKRGWAVGAFGQFLYTKNGGIAWHDASKMIENEMGMHLNAVSGSKDGSVYIGGEAGYLLYSSDAGKSWNKASWDSESTIFDIAVSKDGNAVYSTGLRAQTYRSSDHGLSWQKLNPDVNFSLAGISLQGKDLLLVGAGGSVAFSQDGGDNFDEFTLPSRSSLSGVLGLENGQYVIVGQGGFYRFDPKSAAK